MYVKGHGGINPPNPFLIYAHVFGLLFTYLPIKLKIVKIVH